MQTEVRDTGIFRVVKRTWSADDLKDPDLKKSLFADRRVPNPISDDAIAWLKSYIDHPNPDIVRNVSGCLADIMCIKAELACDEPSREYLIGRSYNLGRHVDRLTIRLAGAEPHAARGRKQLLGSKAGAAATGNTPEEVDKRYHDYLMSYLEYRGDGLNKTLAAQAAAKDHEVSEKTIQRARTPLKKLWDTLATVY